jgi:hypothetical protein
MSDEIGFSAGIAYRWRQALTGGNVQIGNECLSTMSLVFMLNASGLTGSHRLGRIPSFQGLYAGFLIRTHDMGSLIG